jgi:hypothetical protein
MARKFVCDCGKPYIPNPKYQDHRVKCDFCIKGTKAALIKKKCVEYLGGKCVDCKGEFLPVVFDFDHKNPEEKSFKISGKAIYRWNEIKKELDKCDLRCSNCHRLRHYLLENPQT